MTQEKENNDQDFFRIPADIEFFRRLEDEEEIPLWLLEYWYREDDHRKEKLVTAIAKDEIHFRWDPPTAEDRSVSGETASVSLKVDYIKQRYLDKPSMGHLRIIVEVASLKAWLNKKFPIEPDSVSVSEPEVFMSEKLRIAVEISDKLYPNGYKVTSNRTSYSVEKGRIDKELDKANIKKESDLKEWMQKIINPESWS